MYMNYTCNTCNFTTCDKFNYKKHLSTAKHQTKAHEELIATQSRGKSRSNDTAEFICHYCNMTFAKSCNFLFE